MSESACPNCGNQTDRFYPVDTGMRVALQATGQGGQVPDKVCANCFEALSGKVSQGLKLRMERDAREKNKMVMWKNRVSLVRQARQLMSQKAYSEAAVTYEKYIRVLEVVYNLKRGELSPKVFNNSTRSKEMTVIASVYWDLMRIYDTNPRYGDRMQKASEKLAAFLPFSPAYPDIVKRAESSSRSAKNPQVVRNFLRSTKSVRGPCFIASAVYDEDPFAWELGILRKFREERLKVSPTGRAFIRFYYKHSPRLAQHVKRSRWQKAILKPMLRQIALWSARNLK